MMGKFKGRNEATCTKKASHKLYDLYNKKFITLNVKAIGNNTSGSVASSGKFLKACRSFSKGNLTWQYDSNSIQRFNICFKYAFEQKATEDKKTHQIIMTESQKSQSNLENNLNTL